MQPLILFSFFIIDGVSYAIDCFQCSGDSAYNKRVYIRPTTYPPRCKIDEMENLQPTECGEEEKSCQYVTIQDFTGCQLNNGPPP